MAPAHSSSVLVNVKVQISQAGVNYNGAQAASRYKSALGQRLSAFLTKYICILPLPLTKITDLLVK